MILDVEKAVIDYLVTNMNMIIGSGNSSVIIYRYTFPDNASAEAITVYAELPGNHKSVPELEPVGIRITTRSTVAKTAFKLFQNIDTLLDKMVRKNFNDDIECCLCERNSGASRFTGTNGLVHFTALYEMIMRLR
jgi:hypothetical protein